MVRRLAIFLLLMTPWSLSAASVASLVSLEGEVSVIRGGVLIPSEKLADGFVLEAFDSISTGNSGRADVRFQPSTGLDGVVHLDQETSLYLDISPWKQEQTAGIELLTGSVAVTLSSATGSSMVEVRTEVGRFTSSGPRFRVMGTPQGDVLALSEGGKLVCHVGERILDADPGAMVEALTLDRSVRTVPVNMATLDSAVTTWTAHRKQVFRSQADVYFQALGTRYQWQIGRFQRAWTRVGTAKDDPLQGQAAIASLRRVAAPLERSEFRIAALRSLLDEGILSPSLELSRGYSAKDFFSQFTQDSGTIVAQLGKSRSLYRGVADRNGGDFPVASDGSGITSDSDFFN